MRCPRCNGQMSFEKFYALQGVYSGWRCIFCGEIVDQTILENRSKSPIQTG